MPEATMQDARQGRAMQRVEKAWDAPRFLNHSELNMKFQQCLGTAFAPVAACKGIGCGKPKEELHAYRRCLPCPIQCSHRRHAAYIELLPHTGRQMQKVRLENAYHFLFAYFMMVAANWQVTTVFDLVIGLVRRHLVSFLGLSRRTWILPYYYATLKAKCFKQACRS